jgi:hypothetical protein
MKDVLATKSPKRQENRIDAEAQRRGEKLKTFGFLT